jgi:tight adherence protein B
MTVIVILVFASVFLVAVLLLLAFSSRHMQVTKQTVSRLDSLVAAPRVVKAESVDIRRREGTSIPWLDHLLNKVSIFPRLRLLLYQGGMEWTAGALVIWSVACFACVAGGVYWRTGSAALSFGLGMVAAVGPSMIMLKKRRARLGAFEKNLPEALDLMVGALRAGHSLNSALGMVATEMTPPISTEFRKCFDEQTFGLDLRAALAGLTDRVPVQSVRIVVTALLIQKETGGNLAEVLEKAAEVSRQRFRLQRQIRVHTAQGRMTGWVLSLLPVALGVGLYLLNPKNMSVLWERPIGLKVLYGAIAMTVIGGLIIRKIVNVRV